MVCLLAGLHKNDSIDFHVISVEVGGVSQRKNPLDFGVDLDKGAESFVYSLSLNCERGSFSTDSSKSHSLMLMKRSDMFTGLIFMSLSNLVQIQIAIRM